MTELVEANSPAAAPGKAAHAAPLPLRMVPQVPAQQIIASQTVCKRCKQPVIPVEDTYPSWKTHVIAGVCFILGLPFCVFIPYCFDCFGKEVLRCPRCGCYLNITGAPRTA